MVAKKYQHSSSAVVIVVIVIVVVVAASGVTNVDNGISVYHGWWLLRGCIISHDRS